MNNKYNVTIYRKRKTHLRLDVLLFFFYVFYLNYILKNKKFEAKLSDYEYVENLKLKKKEANVLKFSNSNFSTDELLYEDGQKKDTDSLDELKIRTDKVEINSKSDSSEQSKEEGTTTEQKTLGGDENNRQAKIEVNHDSEEDNRLKHIIIGKYKLIYILYSMEFVFLLLFIVFHIMVFLLSQWNIKCYLFIAFSSLHSENENVYIHNIRKLCTHVYINPLCKTQRKEIANTKERFNTDYNFYKPKSELVELKKLNNDIFFFYKHKKYLFDYETKSFHSLEHFDIFNLPFCLKWKGLIDCDTDVCNDVYNNSICNDVNINLKNEKLNSLFNKIDALYHSDKALKKDIKSNKNSTTETDSIKYMDNKSKHAHNLINYKKVDQQGTFNEVIKNNKINPVENEDIKNRTFGYNKNYFQPFHDIFVFNNLTKYGENIYDIPSPCFKKLLYEALLSPFFIFQFFSIILWILDSYWYFGLFSIFILIVLEAQMISKRIKEFNLINSMKLQPQNVYVYRNLQWKIIKSTKLLPGDVYIISNDIHNDDNICSCETLLIEGVCIVDESILTGESVPLIKAAIDKPVEDANEESIDNGIFLDPIDIKNKHKKNIVYAGTNVLMTKNENNQFNNKKLPINGCVGIVLKNGFTTYQGKLVRTIINTSEKINSSSIDSIIFLFILLLFTFCSSGYVVYSLLLSNKEINLYKLVLSVSHIITAVIPPEFPITLSLAVTISIVYLYNLKIYCTEPFRLPYSGKAKICAFDKTGTLTEDNMNVLGLFGLDNKHKKINELNESIFSKQRIPFLSLSVIAGCHSLCTVNNKLLGDPLEKSSFEAFQCAMKSLDHTCVHTNDVKSTNTASEKPGNSSSNKSKRVENFQIYKRFFFSSELQRMTCVIIHEGYEYDWFGEKYDYSCSSSSSIIDEDSTYENVQNLESLKKNKKENANHELVKQYLVVSKGSPEIMKNFLKEIPKNYDKISNSLSIKGYRVICLAAKVLDSKLVSKNITREKIEKDLHFCGFLTFICAIKKLTPSYILDIKKAGIKSIMITGDNALAACQISQDVNIVPSIKNKDILILKLLNSNQTKIAKTIGTLNKGGNTTNDLNECDNKIEKKENQSYINKEKEDVVVFLYSLSLKNAKLTNIVTKLVKIIESNKNVNNRLYFINRENKKMLPFIDNEQYIKMCGKVFSLCITGDIIEYFLQNIQKSHTLFDQLIKSVYIFCRVSPKNKEIIIKTLNKLGNITIMCGDGINDMAALKAAHVGVSLLSIKITYKNKNANSSLKNKENYANNTKDCYSLINAYERNFNERHANSMENNKNLCIGSKYYNQMKLYNEKKKKLESVMESMDDSLPVIKFGEASIASPFTYKGNDIKCVKEIISCGRCTLSKVIMMYKLMIINSFITAFSVSILTLDGVKLSDAQTTIISLLYTTLIVLISKVSPLKSISNYSPPSSLFNISVVISIIAQVFIHFAILIYGWMLSSSYRQPDYVPNLSEEFSPNLVNTCIYYLIYCINISIFSCNYEGLPFMNPIHKNREIMNIFIINLIFLFALVMNVFPFLNSFFSLVSFPNTKFKLLFLFLIVLDIVVPYLFSSFIRTIRLYLFKRFKVYI